MSQALVTAVGIGIVGLIAAAVTGLQGSNLARHLSFGIFSSLITMLAHSMMMFYLIGKGKAVKDAMAESGHGPTVDPRYAQFVGRISAARRPVFSIGLLAMMVTITAALLGASVDTGVLPPIVHAFAAYAAIGCNVAAIKAEIHALGESRQVVDEVNQLIGS